MTSIGVVVCVRNGEGTLRVALLSVVRQSVPPTDVVVIDGGSTDETVAVAQQIPGVRVLAQQSTGLGGARNEGIAVLDTELVAFCDADDRWTEHSLRVRLQHLRTDPACAAVIGHVVRDGETTPRPGHTPGALLVRQDALTRVGSFDESLTIGTDSDWFVRLHQSRERLAVLDDVVLHKGIRDDSLSRDVATYRADLLRVARAYVDRAREDDRDGA